MRTGSLRLRAVAASALAVALLLPTLPGEAAAEERFEEVDVERLQGFRKTNLGAGFGLLGAAIGVTAGGVGLLAGSFDADDRTRPPIQVGGILLMHAGLGPVLGSAIGHWIWAGTLRRAIKDPARFSDTAAISRAPAAYHAAVAAKLSGIMTVGLSGLFLAIDVSAGIASPPPPASGAGLAVGVAIGMTTGAILIGVGDTRSKALHPTGEIGEHALVVPLLRVDRDEAALGLQAVGRF